MKPLVNRIRPYAWGSRTAIATLQGRPVPSAEPEAELWMGAHPSAPSTVDGKSLVDVIDSDPLAALGSTTLARFGVRLPYLLKLLAAAEPLSLQAHPDADQARAGFEAGGPSYVDPFHKPELLVAVEPFEALCGFRSPAAAASDLAALDVPSLSTVVSLLRAGELREAVSSLLRSPASLVDAVAARHPLAETLAARYPGDAGVVVALLLNHVRLRPDEAVYMPAGNLHAYLGGLGVEVMAASDNVLRGGLTPKTVDVPELLRVLRYEVLDDPVVRPVPVAPGVVGWPTPSREFALVKAVVPDATVVPGEGPRILVCVRGAVSLRVGAETLDLAGGESAFVPASDAVVELTGTDAVLFQTAPAP